MRDRELIARKFDTKVKEQIAKVSVKRCPSPDPFKALQQLEQQKAETLRAKEAFTPLAKSKKLVEDDTKDAAKQYLKKIDDKSLELELEHIKERLESTAIQPNGPFHFWYSSYSW